jgi:hypothetical protein
MLEVVVVDKSCGRSLEPRCLFRLFGLSGLHRGANLSELNKTKSVTTSAPSEHKYVHPEGRNDGELRFLRQNRGVLKLLEN